MDTVSASFLTEPAIEYHHADNAIGRPHNADISGDIFGKADYTPVLIETRASCNHLASGYVYTVMTTRTADNGDRM